MDGAPFFAVSQSSDPGLLQTLEKEILPRLLNDVPNQPSEEELAADPKLKRFTLIFDRAGYSPTVFKRLWEDRVAVITYHKNPGDPWPESEFILQKVTLVRETGQILIEIRAKEGELQIARDSRKNTKHHMLWKDLPEEERFHQLLPTKKHFIDTIRLIAYRAETSLACIVREKLARDDDARSLVRQILRTSVDLLPDASAQTLTVHLQHLCAELNSTETLFPGTSLQLVFQPVGLNGTGKAKVEQASRLLSSGKRAAGTATPRQKPGLS